MCHKSLKNLHGGVRADRPYVPCWGDHAQYKPLIHNNKTAINSNSNSKAKNMQTVLDHMIWCYYKYYYYNVDEGNVIMWLQTVPLRFISGDMKPTTNAVMKANGHPNTQNQMWSFLFRWQPVRFSRGIGFHFDALFSFSLFFRKQQLLQRVRIILL